MTAFDSSDLDHRELTAAPQLASVEITLQSLGILRTTLSGEEPSAARLPSSACVREPASIQIVRTALHHAEQLERWLNTYRQLLRLDIERGRLEAICGDRDNDGF